ncbi:MAG: hypothetical protein JWM31_2242, partial [Solirubrobacterales bacterium]|nr:hypothetical protein [Solirubrobacterales bacterium]
DDATSQVRGAPEDGTVRVRGQHAAGRARGLLDGPALGPATGLLLALLALGGCGSTKQSGASPSDPESGGQRQQGSGGEELAADDTATVLDVRRTINAECPAGGAAGASADLRTAVDSLVVVLRTQGPDRIYEVGSGGQAKRLTNVVDEIGKQLKGCQADAQAARLQQWAGVGEPSPLGG